jgi:SAM-dependent methyltransferase
MTSGDRMTSEPTGTDEPAGESPNTTADRRGPRKLGFGGEVARLYARHRRGYPPAVIDIIVDAFRLSPDDTVIDLGCGTGQLTVPLAARVWSVVGVDPQPDMLWLARSHDDDAPNVTWMLGSDEELPAIGASLANRSIGAITVATALHWMDDVSVFQTAHKLVRPGGGIAVVTNGKPLWHLEIGWSRALRGFLEGRMGRPATMACGTDDEAQRRYRAHLASAGLRAVETGVAYTDDLDFEDLVGGVLSAFPVHLLPHGEERQHFRDGLRDAVGDGPFRETVDVGLLFGVRG